MFYGIQVTSIKYEKLGKILMKYHSNQMIYTTQLPSIAKYDEKAYAKVIHIEF